MTEKELYKSAFSAIRVSDQTRQRILNRTAAGTRRPGRRLAAVLAAATLLLALSATALGLAYRADLAGWFGQLWTARTGTGLSDSQARAISERTLALGISAEADGVILTAESLVPGSNSVKILLSAQIPGLDLSRYQKYGFEEVYAELSPEPSVSGAAGVAGVSVSFYFADEAQQKIYLILEYDTTMGNDDELDSGRYSLLLSLHDLLGKAGAEMQTLAAGEWAFEIPLEAASASKIITLEHAAVQAYLPETRKMTQVQLSDIQITATGIRFCYQTVNEGYFFNIRAVMKDGSLVSTANGSGYLAADGETWIEAYNWLVPIFPEDLDAIRMYDSEILLN